MSSREFSQFSVGADAYIGPPGSCEFAADYRKNGAICRVDVGIAPYTETGSACVCAAVKVRYIFPSTFCLEKRIG